MNEKEQEYIIERLSVDRLPHLARLFTEVYGRKPANGYFEKKFDTAFTGTRYIGYIAYSRDLVPFAFYGVVPCFLKYGDRKILAAQSVDTMTHPGYRYKGMFMQLSQLCFQLCRENNILLLFGFPNQNSLPGALKLGWQMGGQLDFFSIPVRCLPLQRISAKSAITKRLYSLYSRQILKKYMTEEKGIPNNVQQQGFIGINRDEAYLQYKTYSHTCVIEAGGAKVWVKIKNGMIIGDIALEGNNLHDVLDVLKTICSRLGITTISYHCSSGTDMHRLFSEKYVPAPSFPALFHDFGAHLPLAQIKFAFADIDIF